MTMVSTPQFWWPSPIGNLGNTQSSDGTNSTSTFDSATDVLAWVGTCPQDLTITDVAFLSGAVTSGPVIDVRIETINTSGRPSNTLWNSGTTNDSNKTITVSGANTWQKVTLTGSASVTAGQMFAIVLRYSSGTANFQVQYRSQTTSTMPGFFPLYLQDTGAGSWTSVAGMPCFIVSSSGTPVHVPGLWCFSTATQTAYNTGSASDEYAIKFSCPFKARVTGVLLPLSNIAAGADWRCFLWDSGGATNTESNALASTPVIDGDAVAATTTDGGGLYAFSAPYTIAAGTTYYVGVRAETANSLALTVHSIAGTPPSNAINSSPSGANVYQSTRAWSAINPGTVGAWTDDATKVPHIRLLIDQVDDGTGTVSVQMPVVGAMI